jgi:hypothetical protein
MESNPPGGSAAPGEPGRMDAGPAMSGEAGPAEPATVADSPQLEWERARALIYPAFRPLGTLGQAIDSIDREMLLAHATQSHAQPLVDLGLAGLPVVYTIAASGFHVVVNGDHLLAWGIEPADIQDAAMRNLSGWSASAPWTTEVSGNRRLISSQTGDGYDAARILLPEVVAHLVRELGSFGRVLVGLPERDLLIAGSMPPGDRDFAGLFASFIIEHSGGADEPIDRRVFELSDGRLIEFHESDAGA